jgi:hypothetical protein
MEQGLTLEMAKTTSSMRLIEQYKRGTEMITIQLSSSHGTASNFMSLYVKIC